MTARTCVVTYDPLSASYIERLRESIGCAIEQVVVPDIGGAIPIIRYFRGLAADTLYVPVVDGTARGFWPVLKILCVLARAGRRMVVNADFLAREFGILDGVYESLPAGGGILGGCVTLVQERFRPGAQAADSAAPMRDIVGTLLDRGRAVDMVTAQVPAGLPQRTALGVCLMEPLHSYVFPWALSRHRHVSNVIAASAGVRDELIVSGVEPGRVVCYGGGDSAFDPGPTPPERMQARDAVPVPPRPVRVLVNALHAKTGGGVTYLRNVLPLLAGDPGMEVHLCVHEDQRPLLPEDLGGVSVHFLSFKSGFWRLQFREQVEVPRLARRIGAHVTFSPANYAPLAAPNSVILLRNALSVAFVERRPVKLAYWAAVYLGTALSLMVCRRAIAVSDYARRSAGGALLRLVGGRIIVVPHGVGPIFSPPEGASRREKFLLSVSDIYVQKNLKNLLYAVARLRASHPDITLKIAGRPIDAHYFASLKRRLGRDGLEGCVEFLGYVPPEDLVDLYRRCAVFVFPSSVETFGNPLVEAMACGAPIASSNTAAMPEVLGDAAVYFDPADVKDMAGVLDRLLKDPGLCRDLGEKALARSRDFSWQRTTARTLDVLKQAATREGSDPGPAAAAVTGEPRSSPRPGPR